MRPRFHLAFPVTDLDATERFYVGLLGCSPGRRAERWLDLDLFGHQISAHLVDDTTAVRGHNPVDGDAVPVPHFGVILDLATFDRLAWRLQEVGTAFVIPPRTRFEGEVGEQRTMFLLDPSGNALEFKAFAHDDMVFAT